MWPARGVGGVVGDHGRDEPEHNDERVIPLATMRYRHEEGGQLTWTVYFPQGCDHL